MYKFIRSFFAITVLLTSVVFADEMLATINVKIGHGRAILQVDGITESEQRQLETELLIDEGLASLVVGNNEIEVSIQIPREHLVINQENLKLFVDQVRKKIFEQNTIQFKTKSGKNHVVMGTDLIVKKNDHLEEVLVLAGTAEIYGTVDRLVVMGGSVILHPTAVIKEELNNIGGFIERKSGAQVQGDQVDMNMPMSDEAWSRIFSQIFNNKLKNWLGEHSPSLRGLLKALIFIILLMTTWMGDYIAPRFQDAVQLNMRKKPVKTILWGVLSGLLIMPITILLMITVIGIPLMPLQFSLVFAFILLGWGHAAHAILFLISEKWSIFKSWHRYGLILLGFILIEIIALVPVIGPIIKWGLIISGFGAVSKEFHTHILARPEKRLT